MSDGLELLAERNPVAPGVPTQPFPQTFLLREGSFKLLVRRAHLLSARQWVCGINDWSPQVTGIAAEHRVVFFSPANFSVFAYVSHIHDSMRAEPQASRPHLFLPALLQASHDVETEYLFLFPCKYRFLTCWDIGLLE